MSASPSPSSAPVTAASEKIEKGHSEPSGPESPTAENNENQASSSTDRSSQSRSSSPSPSHTNDEVPSSSKAENEDVEDGAEVLPVTANAHTNGDWQAIWSPQHNSYYFHNMRTKETTWTNPLTNAADANTSSASTTRYNVEAAALAAGIDPTLAHLDPTLVAGPSNPAAFTYTAKFNSRTGAFTRPDGRNPEHVSEFERMKRMSQFYFDVDEWQKQLELEQAEEEAAGKKRKKPTKKDLVSVFFRFVLLRLCFLLTLLCRICIRRRRSKRSLPRQPGCVHRFANTQHPNLHHSYKDSQQFRSCSCYTLVR